ncbi:portal protein [Vibrio parahaemolyticus]|uniref:Portal protein n=1 Tax=Vibrio parahaemolyticus TaxID=670 RepID=A0AA47JM07_VIBPH|nr:portal protein [Vibrio parahaemolyticus]MEA5348547.1 portal protein [Vibrio parahaemolyticus]WAT93138.1 portal protein [Vibrio parahaemolyticus]
MEQKHTAAQVYNSLKAERDPYLYRGRLCSSLTIPSILPEEGDDEHTQYRVPYSGFGARGIKQLASKIVMALFPPSHPFVRLGVSTELITRLDLTDAKKGDLETALSQTEQLIVTELERRALRSLLYEDIKHLLVTGNGLLYIGSKESRFYRLDKYVVERDDQGTVTRIVVCEKISFRKLPSGMQNAIREQRRLKGDPRKDLNLYTMIELKGDHWHSYQEVEGMRVSGSESSYRKDRSPWIVCTMNRLDGEDYGRSFAEEHIGDLNTHEALVKAITQASIAASKVIFMVKPNASTRASTLSKAKNGDYVQGDKEDVSCLQLDKAHDLAIAQNLKAEIQAGLSEAFLMSSAVRRDAERVTAEEIRMMTQMLEESLGGLYSQLAQSLQLPLVNVLLGHMERDGILPHFPEGTFEPIVITGVEGLGREAELSRLNTFVNLVQQVGAEQAAKEMHLGELFKRYAANLQIETKGLMKTAEEKQQELQVEQMNQLMQTATPQVVQGAMQQQQ